MVIWEATVRAPQGGPIYVHHFEGDTPSNMFREIAEALDLTRADSVEVTMTLAP